MYSISHNYMVFLKSIRIFLYSLAIGGEHKNKKMQVNAQTKNTFWFTGLSTIYTTSDASDFLYEINLL